MLGDEILEIAENTQSFGRQFLPDRRPKRMIRRGSELGIIPGRVDGGQDAEEGKIPIQLTMLLGRAGAEHRDCRECKKGEKSLQIPPIIPLILASRWRSSSWSRKIG